MTSRRKMPWRPWIITNGIQFLACWGGVSVIERATDANPFEGALIFTVFLMATYPFYLIGGMVGDFVAGFIEGALHDARGRR